MKIFLVGLACLVFGIIQALMYPKEVLDDKERMVGGWFIWGTFTALCALGGIGAMFVGVLVWIIRG